MERPGTESAANTVLRKLEASRHDLLDLGLRNPLLNFRARQRSIEVVDELSSDTSRILVDEGRTMRFRPMPEGKAETLNQLASGEVASAEGEPGDPDWARVFGRGDEESSDGPAERHRDTHLQTRLTRDALTVRLIKMHSLARTYIEEQGVSVLYLALGFLHWYEADSSSDPRRAPLVLVPVELERASAKERFKVRYSGGDVGHNLSLQAKLKADFALDLPGMESDENGGLPAYFDEVERRVASLSRWRVRRDEIHLGFFSFGKFLMYRDLDVATWPNANGVGEHPILQCVLGDGFRDSEPSVGDNDYLDDVLAPGSIHTVVDADSSQMLAILDVNEGRNLLIQGPPGTGKSQTITNLIAEALGRGKKVLFVAEKMAALEVVKRRLDNIGIGDAVLELHSHKTDKKALLAELHRTLELGRPHADTTDDDIRTLTHTRDRINAYCRAVNEPVGESAVTPVEALGRILNLVEDNSSLPIFAFAPMCDWSAADYREGRVLVEEMAKKLGQMGRPKDSPFWGTMTAKFSPLDQESRRAALHRAIDVTERAARASAELAATLRLELPEGPQAAATLCRGARRAMAAPHHVSDVCIKTREWQQRRDEIAALVEAGEALAKIHSEYDEMLIPEAWDQDLMEAREVLAHYGRRWWRLLSRRYRRTKVRLAGLCREAPPRKAAGCMALVDAVLEARRCGQVYDRLAGLGEALFRAQWQDRRSDWEVLRQLSDWIIDLYRDVGDGEIPEGIFDVLSGAPSLDGLTDRVGDVERLLEEHDRELTEVESMLGYAVEEVPAEHREEAAEQSETLGAAEPGDTCEPKSEELQDRGLRFEGAAHRAGATFAEQSTTLNAWHDRLDELQWMAEFNRLCGELRKLSLDSLVDAAAGWDRKTDDFVAAYDRTWYQGQYQRAYDERPALQSFDRTSHEHALDTFRRLDRLILEHLRARLMLKHWHEIPRMDGGGELSVLRTEMNKKRRHLPIRRLVERSGRAIQAIKPVFMMSPMSIANFLPPGSVEFDLVIFDEASQVRPADAFGALLRGRQAVVVGDSKQLPPTSFFDVLAEAAEDDEENVTSDQESILGLFAAKGAPSRMLRWHYRSRHESLIAVSNHEFYDDRLVVFPGPGVNPYASGLTFHHLPNTSYARGRSRSNREEAKAVAAAVMLHAMKCPDLTLGVATFSSAQRDAVEMEIEALRCVDESGETFFNAHPEEPFFIKNLENVQGDERDIILVSVGYGKTEEGYMAMNFGPVNREGGERRLNVLMTRARLACKVFANFTADDIDLSRAGGLGVAALKSFLGYAKDRVLFTPYSTGKEPDSPFEEAVLRRLAAHGLDLEPQVGCAGFFIDIGVRDPEQPGRYVLGIECDGATYHSARSARDRDRLREEVLRGLGWEIHRIWSSDWFRKPERETERVLKAVEDAKLKHKRRAARASSGDRMGLSSGADTESASAENNAAGGIRREKETRQDDHHARATSVPYKKAAPSLRLHDFEFHQIDPTSLAPFMREVVET